MTGETSIPFAARLSTIPPPRYVTPKRGPERLTCLTGGGTRDSGCASAVAGRALAVAATTTAIVESWRAIMAHLQVVKPTPRTSRRRMVGRLGSPAGSGY